MARDSLTFMIEDDRGEESELELPARNEVCARCEGYGTHLTPSIGEHAYTAEEFRESFDEEEAAEYFRRGGRYDVQCEVCKGARVVLVVDPDACTTDAQKAALAAYERQERDREAERRERDAELRWEY